MSGVEDESSESSGSESIEDVESESLGPVESRIVKSVVEQTIHQINILIDVYQPPPLSFQLAKERYKRPLRVTKYSEEDVDDKKKAADKIKREKSLLMKLLCGMRDELKARSSVGMVARVARLWEKREEGDEALMQEYWARRSKLHHMKRMITDTKRHNKRISKDKILMAEALQERLEEACRSAGSEFQYCKKWESVRSEQNRLVCKREERSLRKQLVTISERTEDELRVHQATVSYLQFALTRLEEKMKLWVDRYNRDVEERDINTSNLKQKRTEVADQLQELYQLYEEREGEMETFKEVLRKKEKIEEEKRNREKMAVRVQAWWRGVMVRARLGPFKSLATKDKQKKKKQRK